MPKQWADNIYPILPIVASQVTDVTTPMMYIFTVFDPISLAFGASPNASYSAKNFDYVMANYDEYTKAILEGADPENPNAYPKLKEKKWLIAAGNARLAAQKKELRNLGLNKEWIDKIVIAASSSGKAIHNTLTAYPPPTNLSH